MEITIQQSLADHYFGTSVPVTIDGRTVEDRKKELKIFIARREEDMYEGNSGYDEQVDHA